VKIHVVKRGQYLKLIAAKYGVHWRKIARVNHLRNPNVIYPGQRLKIPVPCKKPPKPKPPIYYPPPQPPYYPPPPPPQPSGAWTGKYWPNRYLSGSPWCSKKHNRVNFIWGHGGPGCSIGGYQWSARFTRTRYFQYSGRYRFHIVVDDGVRLLLDGVKIIDKWKNSAPIHYTVDRDVWAGNHSLQIDYYQNVGGSRLQFWVEYLGSGGGGGGGTGPWTCQFFDNTSLSGPVKATRNYNAINFDWGTGAPVSGVTADYFSVRCTGNFGFDNRTYRFYTTVDDGVRVWVGGTEVLNEWIVAGVRTYVKDVGISAGTHPVKVEFFEWTGRAVLKVRWE
jgi:LysM repeat protein